MGETAAVARVSANAEGRKSIVTPLTRRLLVVVLAFFVAGAFNLVGVVTPVLPGTARDVGAESAAGYNPDSEECRFLRLINDFRHRHGRPKLTLLETLGAAAVHHSEDMAEHDYWNDRHYLEGERMSWEKNIRVHNYDDGPIGENILAGTNQALAPKALDTWQKSPGHRENMLRGDFRTIGIGRAYKRSSTYDWYWTTTFGGDVRRTDKVANC